jgi:hypothetical protein
VATHQRTGPKQNVIHHPPSTIQHLVMRARVAGKHVGELCDCIDKRQGQYGIRRILGVLSLVKRYGRDVVDHACRVVLAMAVADYQVLRRYLERAAPAGPQLRQVNALIRDLTHYRDFIDSKAPAPTSP